MRRLLIAVFAMLMLSLVVVLPALADSFGIDFDANNSSYTVTYGHYGAGYTANGMLGDDAVLTGVYKYSNLTRIRIPTSDLCAGASATVTAVDLKAMSNHYAGVATAWYLYPDGNYRVGISSGYFTSPWRDIHLQLARSGVGFVEITVATSSSNVADYGNMQVSMDDIALTYTCAVVADFTVDRDSGTAPLQVTFTDHSTGATSWHWDLGDGNSTTAHNVTYTYTNPGDYTVTLTASNLTSSDTATKVIHVVQAEAFTDAATYKPLTSTDADPDWPMVDGPQQHSSFASGLPAEDNYDVYAYSAHFGADVHAVGSGRVTAVDQITFPDETCTDVTGHGLIGGQCLLGINPDGVTQVYRLDIEHSFRVTVEKTDGQTITYVVDEPLVSVDASISPGCIIGKTIRLYQAIGLDLESVFVAVNGITPAAGVYFSPVTDPISKGITILVPHLTDADHPDEQRLRPLLVFEPDNLTPCNVDPAHSSCQRGANMYNPTDWIHSGPVAWDTLGQPPTLWPGATLVQQWPFDQSQALSFTVNVRRLGTTGHIQIQLGKRSNDFELSQTDSTVSLPALVTTPDSDPLYSVIVANVGLEPIQVTSACVAVGTPSQDQPTCRFINPSFDDGLSSWSHSNDIQIGNHIGEVFVHDNSTLTQTIQLFPDGASPYEYQVTLRAVPAGVGWQSQTTSEVSFSWDYGASSGDFLSPNSSPNYPLSSFDATPNYINFFPGGEVVFQATVLVSAPQNDPFTVTVHYDQEGGWAGPMLIREICVTDAFGSDGTGGGGGNPYQPTCSTVSPPQDTSVASWTYFLWTSLDRFFRCDLMVAVNKGLDDLNQLATFLRWQMLYWQAVLFRWSNWIPGQVIPWLNGHFRNMAVGQVTTVNQTTTPSAGLWDVLFALFGGNGSSNIWDVLTALIQSVLAPIVNLLTSLLSQAAGLLFTAVAGILTLIFAIIAQVFSVVGLLRDLLGALVNAWNTATPTPLSVWSCSDPKSNAFCQIIWVLSNTVFAPGSATSGVLAIALGIGAAHMLIWMITEFQDLLSKIGDAT